MGEFSGRLPLCRCSESRARSPHPPPGLRRVERGALLSACFQTSCRSSPRAAGYMPRTAVGGNIRNALPQGGGRELQQRYTRMPGGRLSSTIPAISPVLELGAFEVLWAKPNASFASLAAMFRENPDKLPSDFVDHAWAMTMAHTVRGMLKESGVEYFGVRIIAQENIPRNYEMPKPQSNFFTIEAGGTWWRLRQSASISPAF